MHAYMIMHALQVCKESSILTVLFLPMAPGLERAQRLATQLVSGGASAAVPRHFDVPPGLLQSTDGLTCNIV